MGLINGIFSIQVQWPFFLREEKGNEVTLLEETQEGCLRQVTSSSCAEDLGSIFKILHIVKLGYGERV